MRASFALAAVLSAASSLAQTSSAPTVNTPTSLIVCQPSAIQYYGGTAPYFLSVLPGGMISAAALESFPSAQTTTAGTYTWTVNLAAGTSVTIAIRDSTGALNYAQAVTIQAGTSTSCLSATTSSGTSLAAASTAIVAATSRSSSAAAASSSSAGSSSSSTTSTSSSSTGAAGSATSAAGGAVSSVTGGAASVVSSAASAATSAAKGGASHQAANGLALVGAAALAFLA